MAKEAVENVHEKCKVPEDWRTGLIVSMYGKGKEMHNTQGNTSAESYYEITEMILDKRLRERVKHEFGEEPNMIRYVE